MSEIENLETLLEESKNSNAKDEKILLEIENRSKDLIERESFAQEELVLFNELKQEKIKTA